MHCALNAAAHDGAATCDVDRIPDQLGAKAVAGRIGLGLPFSPNYSPRSG